MKDLSQMYLSIAMSVAEQSKAERLKVGAIIVKDDNIIAFGYNGTPKGFDNGCEITYPSQVTYTKPEVLHAESNAIAKCARSVNSSEGAVLYCTHSPCFECSKLIIQAGIKEVVYAIEFRDLSGLDLLKQANIKTTLYNDFS